MFKFGVYSIDDLRAGKDKTWYGSTKKVSVSLLNDLDPHEWRSPIYDRIMFELIDDRGTYKRTYQRRFDTFDKIAIKLLIDRFGHSDGSLRIHDAAVSNAQTAADFYLKLSDQFAQLVYFASDYDPFVTLINQGRLSVALSSSNDVLEIKWPPFVFSPLKPERRLFFPLNHLLRWFLERMYVGRLIGAYERGELSGSSVQRVTLFAPSAMSLQETRSNFRLLRHDLLSPSPIDEQLQCIRAMNVLNPTYFDDRQLETAVKYIWSALEDDGIFVVGSNQDQDTQVKGAIYAKTAVGFEPIWISSDMPYIHRILTHFLTK